MKTEDFKKLLPLLEDGVKVKAGSRIDIAKGFIKRKDNSISIWIEKFDGWVSLKDIEIL